MTGDTLLADVEDEYETELSRLGSSKAVYALTGGEMETEAVLAALADRAATAAETFGRWTDDAEFGAAFREAAETATAHADAIADAAEDAEPTDDPRPMDEALRGLDGSAARLGGLLAWTVVADRTLSQAVGFFVGNADPNSADRFRGHRSDVDAVRDRAVGLADGTDEAEVRDAASAVVEAAYGGYVETLEGLGVKVKPVC
jgi:hypothetical protein